MTSTNWVYFQSNNVKIKSGTKFQNSAWFNGKSATLEVPLFSNTYRLIPSTQSTSPSKSLIPTQISRALTPYLAHLSPRSTYKKFSISVWFKRTDIYTGLHGLFSNGDCETDPSILITSQLNSMGVRLETTSHSIRVDGLPVSRQDSS